MTRETKSYELKIYDQSLMRFEAAYDAFGSLKLEITDIDSANAHLLPLNLIVDQDEKSLASWMGKFVVMGEGMAFRVQNSVLWYDGAILTERRNA